MEDRKTGKTLEMVKLTIKRAADSPDNTNWVCKRIDGALELKPPEEAAHGPGESLPAEDENLYEEAEDPKNWHQTIPSYLEVEMKEPPVWESSAEYLRNVLETPRLTVSHETTDIAGNSCSDPMDLSRSYSKRKPQRDVKNVSNKSPTGEHSSKSKAMEKFNGDTPSLTEFYVVVPGSKSKGLENVNGDFSNAPSLTGHDGIVQDEAASHFPRLGGTQNTSTSPNQPSMNSGEVVAMAMRTMPSTSQNFTMTIHQNSPITSGFFKSEKPEGMTKSNILNHLQQEIPRSLKTTHGHFSADARDIDYSSKEPNSHANRSFHWPWTPITNDSDLPLRGKFAEIIEGTSGNKLAQEHSKYLKRLSEAGPMASNDSLELVQPPKRRKSHPEVPEILKCDVCNIKFKSDRAYDRHQYTEKHLKKVNQTQKPNKPPKAEQQANVYNAQPNSMSRPFGPTILTQPQPPQLQPHPHLLYAMANQMQYQQMMQVYAMAAANQSADGKTIMNNAFLQNSYPRISKSDCNLEFMGQNRFPNESATKFYTQDPRHMKLLVNSTNSHGNFLPPRHPLSENSKFSNPKYLESVEPQPRHCHADLFRIQQGNFAKSQPCVENPETNQLTAAVNQSADGKTLINNVYVPNYNPGTSKSDCNVEFPSQNRILNDLETKCHPQDPRHMKLPVNHTSNNRGNSRLFPWNPLSENSRLANPKYLEDVAPEPSHKDPSRIQPGNFRVSMPEPCAKPKSNQPDNLIATGSFQNSEGVRPVSCGQLEFFRVYVCLICSTFHTDDLQALEQHISIDRRKTPIDMIIASGSDLWCKLCDFKTRTSTEMCHHVASEIHLKRADYYNHIMEGDIIAKEKLDKVHKFYPIFLYCSACEFSTTSLDNLKIHSIDPSHQYNVSCCMYISKFSSSVEYCYCRPCRVRTATKRELLLHLRSESHMYTVRQYPSNKRMFHDPAQLFFIKEFSLDINEEARASEQIEGSIFIEGENPQLRKEKNDLIASPAPLDLSSKPLPVTCSLCQQVLPEINALVQHFQRIHGVNEDGVKWLISSIKVREEKSLPTEKLSNKKAGKPKSIVYSPQKSSATDKPLLRQEMGIGISMTAAGQNLERKPSTSSKGVSSEQTMAMVENLNGEKIVLKDSSSSHQLPEIEGMQNPDKLDRKTEGSMVKDFPSSQQLRETECMQNEGRSSKDSSPSQQFYEKEEMLNSSELDQNLNSNEGVNIDPASSQQCLTRYIPLVEEEIPNSEENLNSSSSQAEVIVEYTSDPNADGKSETLTDESSSEHVSAIEGLLPLEFGDDSNPKRKRNDSTSNSFNPPSKKKFCDTENVLPLGEEKVPNSRENLNYNSPQAEVIVEYKSGPNGKNETETEDFINENFSATEHGSPSPSYHKKNRERNDISSEDHDSVTHERLTAIDDSSVAPASLTYELLSDSSVANVSRTHEQLPAIDDSPVARGSPTHEPLPTMDDSSVAPASPTHERFPVRDDSSIAHASPRYERLSDADNSSVVLLSPISQSDPSTEKRDSSSSDIFATPERLLTLYDSLNKHSTPTSQSVLKASRRLYDFSSSDHNSVSHDSSPITHDSLNDKHRSPILQSNLNASRRLYNFSSSDHNSVSHDSSPITHDSLNDKHRSPISQSNLNASRERNDSLLSDHNSISHEPITNDSFNDEHRSPISQSDLNASKERSDSSLSGQNSQTASVYYLATEHECPKPQSDLKTMRKRSNSSSSDEIFIQYEWLPARARGASSPIQQNLLDSENSSPLNDEQNLNLGEDVVNDSPISRLTALEEPKQPADSNSIINTNSSDSMNGELVLYDCPNEYEAELTAPNSPVASALQIQAGKDIENIEIMEVFSLKGRSNSEGEESSHFENVVLSDSEDS